MIHIGTNEIKTSRLLLRQFLLSDAQEMFHAWASDAEVTKYLRWPPHETMEASKEVISRWVDDYKKDMTYHWAITLVSGELIGSIGIGELSEYDSRAEVGYCIGSAFWGKGYMAEALSAVIQYMIFNVGLNRIEAFHSLQNPASGRVMQKAGMTYEGVSRQKYLCSLGFQDCALYAALKSDFEEVQLILPTFEYRTQFEEMVREFIEYDPKIVPFALTYGIDNFDEILQKAADYRNSRNLPEGHVPSTTYWLLRKIDNRLLGAVDIRHTLNDYLRNIGGNIGYGIRPTERRRGYAAKMLSLALEKCRELGLTEALVSCDTDNIGSAKTIQKNGGILIGEGDDGVPFQRYKIIL